VSRVSVEAGKNKREIQNISSIRTWSARRLVEPTRTKNAFLGTQPIQIVGPVGTGINLHCQNLGFSPGHHFDERHQPWGDAVRNQIGETFFLGQFVRDALDLFRTVFDSHDENTPGGIGERNNDFQRAVRKG
jgi:hypothetical protein